MKFKDSPKVSIIIPAYNAQDTLSSCLKSIQAQTFQDYEIIAVNDGSSDKTLEILKKFQSLFRQKFIIIDQENQGSNPARNRGAKEAQGEYILFCDADIILKENFLEKMVKTLEENPDKSYAYSSFLWGFKKFKLGPFNPEKLKEMNYIHTTSLIRRKHFLGFDEKIKKFQDWDLWLSMLEKGYQGIWINEILFKVIPKKKGISFWFPKFFYKIPWQKLGIKIKALEEYEKGRRIIYQKHHIDKTL